MSAENRLTKEKVLIQVSLDLCSKAVKLFEQGHVESAEALTNMALDVDSIIIQTEKHKSESTRKSKS